MTTPRLLPLAALLATAACQDHLPTSIAPDGAGAPRAAQVIEGEAGPGALYRIHLPDGWNGQLVLYAHGFRDPAEPVTLRDQDGFSALRDSLLHDGYAVAYSSFSENGLAFKDAAQRTHQLRGIFAETVAEPQRVYLAGHSLGAVATLTLAERYPAQYAGALAMCGQLAGTQAMVDYFAHVRVLFDYFYPGVLPGDAMNVPAGVDLSRDVVLPALQAMQANPTGAGAMVRIMAELGMPVPAASGPQLVESIVRALGYNFRALPDLYERTHGHIPFDNTATRYASAALPAQMIEHLNATVDRFAATPDARNYLEQYYLPTGELHVPLVTLANALDPVSPPFNEPTYAALAAAAGRQGLLTRRTAESPYGHCVLSTSETLRAFDHLVGRVEGA